MASKQLRERIAQYYNVHARRNKLDTVEHFTSEGISKTRIYNIIRTVEQRGTAQRKARSGRQAKIMTPKVLADLKKRLDNSDDLSFNQVSKQLGCHRTHVSRTVRREFGIKHRKKVKVPKYKDEQQIEQAKTLCG